MNKKRLFIAVKIPLNDKIDSFFTDAQSKLSEDKIKWVEKHNLHITLKFLGDTNISDIDKIINALCKVQAKPSGFEIEGCGVFPRNTTPKVLWLGCNDCDDFISLQEEIESLLSPICGEPRDNKKFTPHLTIGRIRQTYNTNNIKNLIKSYNSDKFTTVNYDNFILYESVLKREGPEYKVIGKFEL